MSINLSCTRTLNVEADTSDNNWSNRRWSRCTLLLCTLHSRISHLCSPIACERRVPISLSTVTCCEKPWLSFAVLWLISLVVSVKTSPTDGADSCHELFIKANRDKKTQTRPWLTIICWINSSLFPRRRDGSPYPVSNARCRYFCHPDWMQQLCIISSLWKRNTIWAKKTKKGFIGDVRDSESWQLHHGLDCCRHLSDMASCTVAPGSV